MNRRRSLGTLVGLLPLVAGTAWAADPPGTTLSRGALRLCHRAERAAPDDKAALLARSLARADQAVAADERDALAHFARFCALGEQARLAGARPTTLLTLRALRAAVERTLALAPDFPDALLGKGELLLRLPSLLGGDAEEGERLVRRALAVDPDFLGARTALARALAARGAHVEARAEATRALAVAERKASPDDVVAARALLAELAR